MSDFDFLAPARLLLLVVPIALLVGYLVLQLRRRRYAVRFTNVALLDEVAPDRPGWRRHLPAAVLVLGVTAATLAFARPAVAEVKTDHQGVVILAIDVSLSMEATDVTPSRIEAAKDAAHAFLENVPKGVRIGVVAFDGTASQLLAPTADVAAVGRTIDRLRLGEGTAIGEAVFTSLDTIKAALAHDTQAATEADSPTTTAPTDQPSAARIVLLSDGETTSGRSNQSAAAAAKQQGVPVDTIAFGTDRGSVQAPDGSRVQVPVNRAALQDLARTTGGRYSPAVSADQLKQVYAELGRTTVPGEKTHQEVGDWFAGAALALLALAGTGSLFWFSRLP